MGQTINKLSKGMKLPQQTVLQADGEAIKKIVDRCYSTLLEDVNNTKPISQTYFHHAVCKTVEAINVELGGSTQILIPSYTKIIELYEKNRDRWSGQITRDKFVNILRELITGAQIGGRGKFRDILLYIYGFPVTALLIKQILVPDAISNDILIPAATSASVFALAKQNKI
ncbi:hypothetical protein H6P81_002536 [Aristolochia fimbriata]|uniref:Uncharacterized protein n=1 Tax=Aristolochia fimbriata TaxID=158543 RepID=A0AAV7FEL6_ARIFI|nr:hypothetical protein H6P81_002536 [Aristolochia fimbriata]